MMKTKPKWFKPKGYLHITPTITVTENNWRKIYGRISTPDFIAKYAFYPLIHRIISARRYKKGDPNTHLIKNNKLRAHSHKHQNNDTVDRNKKDRPLHYASHYDSLIYAYYAHLLSVKYENLLSKNDDLDKAVLAYRYIPISKQDRSGKSNIHFAQEVFQTILNRVNQDKEVGVLALDLKGFFPSLDHDILYKVWADLIKEKELPADHLNVFRSCTNFSYILYNDLKAGKRKGFDEAQLAKIRKSKGIRCFFESNEAFRKAIKNGELSIYKNPFFSQGDENKQKRRIGIPQGLPISAVLANIYLYDFDKEIVEHLVQKEGIEYRRYSDDILLVCRPDQMEYINQYISDLITKFKVKISHEKTEKFEFRHLPYNANGDKRITSIKIEGDIQIVGAPLTYLGFEYRGYNTLIKSTNLAKYYRRLISIIKSRSRRAIKLSESDPTVPRAVYINQIKKLYNTPLRYAKAKENKEVFRRKYSLVLNDRGDYDIEHKDMPNRRASNYISYIRRCDRIFGTQSFSRQLRKKRQIIGKAINLHMENKR